MLTNVFADFLDTLESERAFDAPFVCLLRVSGFEEIHCIHGLYEFGKDFIAKKAIDGQIIQYLFQTKKGDITKEVWTKQLQPQCETMVYTGIGHPNFDRSLPRQLVLVATGEMRGQAAVLAEQYAEDLQRRHGSKPTFWTRNILAEQFAKCSEKLLALTSDDTIEHHKNWGRLFSYLESVDIGEFSFKALESITRSWTFVDAPSAFKSSVELMLSRDVLRRRGLRIHATLLTLAAGRSLASDAVHSNVGSYEPILRRLFLQDVDEVLEWIDEVPKNDRKFCLVGGDPYEILIAQGRLLHWLEFISAGVLLEPANLDRIGRARSLFSEALELSCTTRPLGERYAVSVLLVAVAGTLIGLDVKPWLVSVAVWLGDRFENEGLGLAAPRASTEEELWRTLGDGVVCNRLEPRNVSSMAAALLDACSILGDSELYNDIRHDCLAVDVIPFVFTPITGTEQYFTGNDGVLQAYGDNYSPYWLGEDNWKNAGTHHRADNLQPCEVQGYSWLGVSAALVLRDRWWLAGLRALMKDFESSRSSEP